MKPFESAITLSRATLMKLGIDKIEAEEIIKEVRTLDQERLNEEVLHGFSNEIVKNIGHQDHLLNRILIQKH